MGIADSTAVTKNWIQESLVPLTFSEKWSTTIIWIEKQKEQIKMRKSPLLRERLPVIHRRYRPASAITTLIQIRSPGFFFRKIHSIGTMMIYKAVINPALPTVVYLIPTC